MICLGLHCDCALVIILKLWNARQLRKNTQKWFKGWLFKKRAIKQVSHNHESHELSHAYFLVAIHYLVFLFLHAAMSNTVLKTITALENGFSLICVMPCLNTFLHWAVYKVIIWLVLSKHLSGWLHKTSNEICAKYWVEKREKQVRDFTISPWFAPFLWGLVGDINSHPGLH